MSLGVGIILGVVLTAGVIYGLYRLYRALKDVKD